MFWLVLIVYAFGIVGTSYLVGKYGDRMYEYDIVLISIGWPLFLIIGVVGRIVIGFYKLGAK